MHWVPHIREVGAPTSSGWGASLCGHSSEARTAFLLVIPRKTVSLRENTHISFAYVGHPVCGLFECTPTAEHAQSPADNVTAEAFHDLSPGR
jgi:hypothetical protein